MAFEEYRDRQKISKKYEFDIERFAYDIFSYMLRISGFPEEKIPTSSLKDNIYIDDDFVMNVGLSALPISLYLRDEWRLSFEKKLGKSGINNILEIQNYLESFIAFSCQFEFQDNHGQIQFSLALYAEYTLFLNFKGIETYFEELPKLWSRVYKQLLAQELDLELGSKDLDEALESSLSMCPDISESWISHFIRHFAVPYGSSNDISDRFSLYVLKCHTEEDSIPKETSTEAATDTVPQVASAQPPDVSKEYTVPILPEGSKGSNSELLNFPHTMDTSDCLGPLPVLKENTNEDNTLEERIQFWHKNGMKYVLKKCLKGTKRGRSEKLEVEDAFERINFGKENVSPENRDTKRRRRASGMDKLE